MKDTYIETIEKEYSRARLSPFKKYGILLFFIGSLLYMELVFHLYQFREFSFSMFYEILFAIPAGLLSGILSTLFRKEKTNRIITFIILFIWTFLFWAQIVYYAVFKTYLAPFSMLNVAGQAFNFLSIIGTAIFSSIISLILVSMPLFLWLAFLRKKLYFGSLYKKERLYSAIAAIGLHVLTLLILLIGGKEIYSAFDVYYHSVSTDIKVETLGVITASRLDLKQLFIGSKAVVDDNDFSLSLDAAATEQSITDQASTKSDETESSQSQSETNGAVTEDTNDQSLNILDIDFDTLISESTDEILTTMHQYFSAQTGTKKNEYTGLYEGYNVIVITAEAFSPYCVSEELTPTLYKMINTGYVFENYYTPLWYGSTSGGEYANLTSLLPKDGGYVSMKESGERSTNMYFTLGRQLSRNGYRTMAFHNNDFLFYGRDVSHTNMGYEWIASGNGFVEEVDENGESLWPQSDLKLIDDTFSLYSEDEPFHVYYMTVSGHTEYSFANNAMAARNQEAVADLPYSEEARAYIACNIELDKAMESLLNQLEEAGLADNTLIVLSADHVPYQNKELCDEIAGYTIEENFDWYRNELIIWTKEAEESDSVIIDRPCSSLDILPTISNLLGLEYDSRLMMGQDIFSDSTPLVIFKDRSFITDTCKYNSNTDEVTSLIGEDISEEYIETVRKIIRYKFDMSENILEYDYYSYIDEQLALADK